MTTEIIEPEQLTQTVWEGHPVLAWPPFTREEQMRLRQTVFTEAGPYGTAFPGVPNAIRSVIYVPPSALTTFSPGTQANEMLSVTESVARQTGRNLARFGYKKDTPHLGLATPLSPSELAELQQVKGLKPIIGIDLARPVTNPDSSVTYTLTDTSLGHKLTSESAKERMSQAQADVFKFIMPRLGGVVACKNIVVLASSDKGYSLFGL